MVAHVHFKLHSNIMAENSYSVDQWLRLIFTALHTALYHLYTEGIGFILNLQNVASFLFSSICKSVGSLPPQTSEEINCLHERFLIWSCYNLIFHLCMLSRIKFFVLLAIPTIPVTALIHSAVPYHKPSCNQSIRSLGFSCVFCHFLSYSYQWSVKWNETPVFQATFLHYESWIGPETAWAQLVFGYPTSSSTIIVVVIIIT